MNFAFLFGTGARDSAPSLAPHEGPAREPRHDRHGVVRGAEFQVCLVRETLETLRRAVIAQRPRGAAEVTLDDGARPTRPARHPAPPDGAEGPRPRPRFPKKPYRPPGRIRRPSRPETWPASQPSPRHSRRRRRRRRARPWGPASTTLVPFVVERATLEPEGKFDARISVGGLPKSKPDTFALPRSPMRRSAGSDAASSMEATGVTRAPLATGAAIGVLVRNVSTTTTTDPARAAARLPPCPRIA
jgi:hypothetical protein